MITKVSEKYGHVIFLLPNLSILCHAFKPSFFLVSFSVLNTKGYEGKANNSIIFQELVFCEALLSPRCGARQVLAIQKEETSFLKTSLFGGGNQT